eukprot:352175-Chlamydomonas_euryale.AAC.1
MVLFATIAIWRHEIESQCNSSGNSVAAGEAGIESGQSLSCEVREGLRAGTPADLCQWSRCLQHRSEPSHREACDAFPAQLVQETPDLLPFPTR